MAAATDRMDRSAPLPTTMQGRWVSVDDPSSELVIEGSEITCYGSRVDYDYKEVGLVDGALVVDLGIDDKTQEDTFQRTNITGLVLTPEGEFHVHNVDFGDEFMRPDSFDQQSGKS